MDNEENAVEIGSYFEKLITEQVATGRFASKADVLQAGLRLLEEQQLRFHLKKSELDGKDTLSASNLEGSVSDVSQILNVAVQAMDTSISERSRAIPAIPATKGLLRSQIAAE
ncbi:ribbon-helix-helix domain-containing protein [Cohaesibacter celericrescens]|uniref:ribbon-helix-helix domain-containing protein n=1 Tax=Cohaesibacter celericrescens TaxID=2067669 RepID=UPI0015E0D6F0|nr:type II toxin-antitoxin system ParD family antitoxin [Cohaesibacter celericrescens]